MDRPALSTTGDSLYEILDLPKTATQEEVRKRYHKLALQFHPDKNRHDPQAAEKFKEVNRAYAVLGDINKRNIYDRYGSLGIYIEEHFGEQYVRTYLILTSTCCKVCFLICGLLTGCYLCCCCCCCCNFCCGRCTPFEEPGRRQSDNPRRYEPLNRESESSNQKVVAVQPNLRSQGVISEMEIQHASSTPVITQPMPMEMQESNTPRISASASEVMTLNIGEQVNYNTGTTSPSKKL